MFDLNLVTQEVRVGHKNGYCKMNLVCDSAPLSLLRKDKGVCARCEQAQAKRLKQKPLRGGKLALRNVSDKDE